MPNSDTLSAWAFAVAIAGAFFGEQASAVIGTYGLIFAGWFFGLMFGLWMRPMDAKMPMWAYALFTLGITMFGAVTAADMLSKWTPFDVSWTSLLFPVAVAIPALPHKWADIGDWIVSMWKAAKGTR